nr:MAG TPA: hypothetical protein [Caudoviricetes sp.]
MNIKSDSKSCGLRPCQFESDYPYQSEKLEQQLQLFLLSAFLFRQGCLYIFFQMATKYFLEKGLRLF